MANINVRVDDETKRESALICEKLGLNLTTAVNMFLHQIVICNGMPFDVTLERPNAETIAAMRESEDRRLSKAYSSTKELMEALDA